MISRRGVVISSAFAVSPPPLGVWTTCFASDIEIRRTGSQPSTKGSADYFTGTVRIDPGVFCTRAKSCIGRQRHVRTGFSYLVAYAFPGSNRAVMSSDLGAFVRHSNRG